MIVQILLGVLALGSVPAPATHDAKAAGEEPACLRVCATETTTRGQRECLGRELDLAQKELDAALGVVEISFSKRETQIAPSIPQAFKKAQVAWAAYYTADCEAVATAWTDGSGRRGVKLFCLLDHTRRRTRDIWLTYHLEGAMAEPAIVCSDLRPDA